MVLSPLVMGSRMSATKKSCRICLVVRTFVLSAFLGAGAGYGVLAVGGSAGLSMAATFFAAIAPILWLARQNRISRTGSE